MLAGFSLCILTTTFLSANRYFGLLQFPFVVTLLADIWSPSACKHVYFWEPVGALISTVLSQMILGSRVYAIFGQNKAIAFILGLTLVVEVIIGGIAIGTTSPPPPSTAPAGSGPPCGAVMGPFGWLLSFWAIPLFYDGITFLLTAWKAYDFWKKEVNTPLFNVIWRDGLLYFFVIFSMNITNVVILSTAPKTLRAINFTPTLILEVILSCRLLLNLRSAGGSSASKPQIHPWFDNSKTHVNPSSSVLKEQTRTDPSSSTHGTEKKLEPNRRDSTWNAQSLYTN
ncbi:hypothetical protein BYT27DRAFT_6777588 [Phlegmacium glaucopus]|nr:hypothetical protein BYT27DRAFT_6777588 [Phlegmacium glaucopus]